MRFSPSSRAGSLNLRANSSIGWPSGKFDSAHRQRLTELLQLKLEQCNGDIQAGLKNLAEETNLQGLTPSQMVTVHGSAIQGSVAGMALPPAVARVTVPSQPPLKPAVASTNRGPRYVRVRLHAAGGIGQVFLAHDTRLERDVALKELRPEAAQDPSMGWRFLKEAHMTGQLEHPGVVPIYELVTDEEGEGEGGVPYYVMRFLSGHHCCSAYRPFRNTTANGRRSRRRWNVHLCSTCSARSVQTMAYAHSQGIIHRDLKGANILLGDLGEVVVLDWGLAKKVNAEDGNKKGETAAGNEDSSFLDQETSEHTLPGTVLRHALLHVARTGRGQAGRRAGRHLQPRRHSV